MATKKKKTENPDMQAPKEDQEALWNALGHNSLADPETPGYTGPDFETEYGHLTTQVPQLLKAILRELYLIRRAR